MSDRKTYIARVVSVVAATVASLACGTNYGYSAWGPAFAQKMLLTSTQSNLIGLAGSLGMYGSGIPFGMLVDYKGPRYGTLLGAVLLLIGYVVVQRVFEGGPGSMPLWLICFFTFLTGCGSSSTFSATIKVAAANWPANRGTATAFALAGLGLSAFFYSTIAAVVFPGNTSGFLLLLGIGTFVMITISTIFLRIVPLTTTYSTLPTTAHMMKKRKRAEPGTERPSEEAGSRVSTSSSTSDLSSLLEEMDRDDPLKAGEASVGMLSEKAKDIPDVEEVGGDSENTAHASLYADVRGWRLLKYIEFYQLFLILGILCGIGLMTINNIGNNVTALWKKWDDKKTDEWIQHRQALHVSVISLGSFSGRLLSGIGSDIIVKRLHKSRLWVLVLSSFLFLVTQIIGRVLENPNLLFVLSGMSGVAYGFLFGCYPSIISEVFGIAGLSQNWGTMTMAPIAFANVFNILYGRIYDAHSVVHDKGHLECLDGVACYAGAYELTSIASMCAIPLCLWAVWHEQKVRKQFKEEYEMVSEHLS